MSICERNAFLCRNDRLPNLRDMLEDVELRRTRKLDDHRFCLAVPDVLLMKRFK